MKAKPFDQNTLQQYETSLQSLKVGELRARFAEIVGYPSRSRNRPYLIRKILWGLQAQASGGLPVEVKERALERADDRDVQVKLPPATPRPKPTKTVTKAYAFTSKRDRRLPVPGSVLVRQYQGREIRVMVGEYDFEFAGRRYRSLSAIAKEITGSSYNGFLFFKLT